MHLRIIGPVRAHFIGAYACPVGELGNHYVGHYRIFSHRPGSFWDTDFLQDSFVVQRDSDPASSIARALAEGLEQVVGPRGCQGFEPCGAAGTADACPSVAACQLADAEHLPENFR
jgi:hypothetical protein